MILNVYDESRYYYRNMENIDCPLGNFSDALEIEEPILTTNLELWMTQLPPPLKTIPIIHLAIPGSHNTMTYTIQRYDDVGPDESMTIRFLGRYFSLISKPVIFNWSITQYDDVKEQLNGGIRYLDLRLATKPGDNNIYFLHGLYGSEISRPLRDVADWLSLHPGEVVILDFQHFYSFKNVHHQFLVNKIQNIFNGKLCPALTRFNNVSLQQLVLEKYQVFVIYRDITARNHVNLWPSMFWPTPWPNTICPSYLINFLNMELKLRSPNTGFVSQCLLTPDTLYVVRHFCGNLERNLVTSCQCTILSWINEKCPGSTGLNIVIADFVSRDDFIFSKTVIQRNAKLLSR